MSKSNNNNQKIIMSKSNHNNKKIKKKGKNTIKIPIKKKLSHPSFQCPIDIFVEILEHKNYYENSWKKYLQTRQELSENVIVGIPYFEY